MVFGHQLKIHKHTLVVIRVTLVVALGIVRSAHTTLPLHIKRGPVFLSAKSFYWSNYSFLFSWCSYSSVRETYF